MNRLLFILLPIILTAQPSAPASRTSKSAAIKTAQMLEQRGDRIGAIAIYEDLLSRNAKNTHAYRQLKNLYKQERLYSSLETLIKNHLKFFPNDLQSRIELGDVYYAQNDTAQAVIIWRNFEKRYGKNSTTYTMLLYTYSRHHMEEEMQALAKRGRKLLGEPALLSLELANYYSARNNYHDAMTEFIRYAVAHPNKQRIVIDRILRMSDSPDSHVFIESTLKQFAHQNTPLIRTMLSAFYFKIRQYKDAYSEHSLQGLSTPKDVSRWITFAKNLHLDQQYELAIQAYQFILSVSPKLLTFKKKGQALLGLGQSFEEQILPQHSAQRLVMFFPENTFFKQDAVRNTSFSTSRLESAFHMYDSVLVTLPSTSFSGSAFYRVGEIQYRITHDFDGALASYQEALRYGGTSTFRQKTHLRIADVYLAMGNLQRALEYLESVTPSFSELRVKRLQAFFLSGDMDTTQILVKSELAVILPDNAMFNDLMELQDIIQQHYFDGSSKDKSAFLRFIKAEYMLYQHKLSEAIETLKSIRTDSPNTSVVPVAMLREALIRLAMEQPHHALDLAEQLTNTHLADMGWTLQGEIIEYELGNTTLAMDFYQVVLEDYPLSLLSEPVRYHIRELLK